jgi:hypothetical protein
MDEVFSKENILNLKLYIYMKNKTLVRLGGIKTLLLATMVAASFSVAAQVDWSGSGNAGSGALKLGGTTTGEDVNFVTEDFTRMTLTANGWLGIGITAPRGWQELNYCPPVGTNENGLIVTLNKCYGNVLQVYSDRDQVGGGIQVYAEGDPNEGPLPFKTPLNYLTGSNTNLGFPLFGNQNPMFWVRQQSPNGFWQNSGPDEFDTKFIVMPDGSCGINIAAPRAALDVRGSNGENFPAAIIGARAIGYNTQNGNQLAQYYTQQVQFVPKLKKDGYNQIVQAGDQGMFFTDGLGENINLTTPDKHDGSNQNGSFVLAPWAASANPDIGGMRMDKNGNTEFHGTLRATKMNVDAKWWADFVFDKEYILPSLNDVEAFIAENKHLPDMPSEAEVLENGLDLGEMQALQQQKIEELTLYIIQQQKQIDQLLKTVTQLTK